MGITALKAYRCFADESLGIIALKAYLQTVWVIVFLSLRITTLSRFTLVDAVGIIPASELVKRCSAVAVRLTEINKY